MHWFRALIMGSGAKKRKTPRETINVMKKISIGLFLAAIATAQPASPTKALSHFIHAVDDLDTTLAFYNNVFGLKGNPSVSRRRWIYGEEISSSTTAAERWWCAGAREAFTGACH